MKKAKEQQTVFAIPADRYNYFRNELRSGDMARAEMVRHLLREAEAEVVRHQKAFDELANLAGYENVQAIKKAGFDMWMNWDKSSITLKPVSNP